MKLYVWQDVLCDYTRGMAVVYARNEKEAKEIMAKKFEPYIINQLPFSKVKIVTEPDAFYIYGGN